MMLRNSLTSAFLQVVLFIGIGLLPFFIYYRKKYSLSEFYGLVAIPKGSSKSFIKLALSMVPYIALNIYIMVYIGLDRATDIRVESFYSTGWSFQTIAIIFLQSVVQTSFTEEISFRGYIINFFKKNKLGFWVGNMVQTVLFVCIHWLACLHYPVFIQICMIVSLAMMCLSWGYINHKELKGSIIYTWILHGITNFLTGFIIIYFVS